MEAPPASNPACPDSPRSFLDDLSLSKLRLICSYGGRILPHPHDKSLSYVGGDTRLLVVDRNATFSSFSSRLSSTLLNSCSFTLKYQLPNEDLDSLISVTTDEDFDNMVEEYDRTTCNKTRIRLFLFPDSTHSMGPFTSVKSEDWFVSALNCGGNELNRGFSDSATVNCLLGLDEEGGDGVQLVGGNSGGDGVVGADVTIKKQEVHSVPDSPLLETTSSFDSASSLPPIRVHAEDGGVSNRGGAVQEQKVAGIEEQFAQVNMGDGGGKDGGFAALSSPQPTPVSIVASSNAAVGEYVDRVILDDERYDHGVPVAYRKPLPQSAIAHSQSQQRSSGGVVASTDLASPDSVSSDSSFGNPMIQPKPPLIYHEQVMQIPSTGNRVVVSPVDPKITHAAPNNHVLIQQQVSDAGYSLQPQYDPQQHAHHQQPSQQYIHVGGAQYIQQHAAGSVPISAYAPVYPPQPHHPQHHHQLDQQYPSYYVMAPPTQSQPYNLHLQQTTIREAATNIPVSRPQMPPNPTVVPSTAATYNAIRNTPVTKPEMAASSMYRTATPGGPQFVQVPSSQHQQQYVGYTQVHHPSQSAVPLSTGNANYAYEYADPARAQIYYTQPLAPTIPSQYQTMTAAPSVTLPEASPQLPSDNIKQQIRTSHPI